MTPRHSGCYNFNYFHNYARRIFSRLFVDLEQNELYMQEGLQTLKRLHVALDKTKFPNVCLKPKQVQCFDSLLKGFDVITVLTTGFGKSILFQLLPDFLPVKT